MRGRRFDRGRSNDTVSGSGWWVVGIGLASHHLEEGRAGSGRVVRGRRRGHRVEEARSESRVEVAEA